MLRSLKDLTGFSMLVAEGPAGVLEDAYLDDRTWAIRHLVLRAQRPGGDVSLLIPPSLVRGIDWLDRCVRLGMAHWQLALQQTADTDPPVSRQKELEAERRFSYIACAGIPGGGHGGVLYSIPAWPLDKPLEAGDPHLCSARELLRYRVRAVEGKVGRIIDLLFDEKTWAIPFLGIATRQRFRSLKTVVPSRFASSIQWSHRMVTVTLGRDRILVGPSMPSLEALVGGYRSAIDGFYDPPVFGGPEGM